MLVRWRCGAAMQFSNDMVEGKGDDEHGVVVVRWVRRDTREGKGDMK
jgi:hypothetical protein